MLADEIDEAGVIDSHHFRARRRRDCGRRAGRAVDHGHLTKEFAPAELDDGGLADAAQLGDLDFAVEHDEQLAAGRALLEDDVIEAKLVDALLDSHDTPKGLLQPFWLTGQSC
ncbi:hypothetical protein ACVWZZ_002681 [Bradyrhizobium sp. LM6.10]